jgi:subtilisin family serine protease
VAKVDVEGVRHARAAESVPLIHGDEAHNMGFTGKGIVVAVLDTGIDSDHRDLFDAIVDQQCFCSGSCRCPNGSQRQSGPGAAEDDEGHGTNVTGIINSAGRVAPVGVAPDTGIVALKVLGADGGGGDAGILSALDYVIARREIRVVNMSLGGGRFSTVCDNADASNRAFGSAIATLRAQGTITLVAAGNDAFTDAVSSPACVNAAVAVGAVYDQNIGGIRASKCVDPTTAPDQVACFSNSSTLVELLGPGAMITSSGLGGGTLTEGGTSQATPHVAGAAALLFQANPALTPSEVVSTLSRTGVPIRDSKSGVTIPRIDVKAALDAVR